VTFDIIVKFFILHYPQMDPFEMFAPHWTSTTSHRVLVYVGGLVWNACQGLLAGLKVLTGVYRKYPKFKQYDLPYK
jgi:hypothetical protein